MENKLDTYVTVSEVAQFLHVSRVTVYNLVRKGLLPSGLKIGNNRRWKLSEIKEALEKAQQQEN